MVSIGFYSEEIDVARTTVIQLTDDLDGSDGDESVSFSFRGTEYEIDLNAKNAAALEKALGKYIEAARRVPKSRGAGRVATRAAAGGREDVSAIRDWARANGYEISDRGRIPAEIREAYQAS